MKKYIIPLFVMLIYSQSRAADHAVIKGTIPELMPGDSVVLLVWKDLINEIKAFNLPHKRYACLPSDGQFRFRVPADKRPSYFSVVVYNPARKIVHGWPVTLVPFWLLHAGDSSAFSFSPITVKRVVKTKTNDFIDYTPGEIISVNGSHAVMFQCKKEIKAVADSFWSAYKPPTQPRGVTALDFILTSADLDRSFREQNDVLMAAQHNVLKRFEKSLNKDDYQSLFTDIYSYWWNAKYKNILSVIREIRLRKLTYTDRYQRESDFREYCRNSIGFSFPPANVLSKDLGTLLYNAAKLSYWAGGSKGSLDDHMYNMYSGVFRERTVCFFLVQAFEESADPVGLVNKTLRIAKDSYCRSVLTFVSARTKGKAGFNFALADTRGKIVRLSDFKGKVVLLDFWYTGCSNCAGVYREVLSKAHKQFKDNKQVVFVTISIDRDKGSWINSVVNTIYTTPDQSNVVNLYTGGKGLDNPVIKHYNITAFPMSLLIGKNGMILNHAKQELKEDAEKLYKVIEAAL